MMSKVPPASAEGRQYDSVVAAGDDSYQVRNHQGR